MGWFGTEGDDGGDGEVAGVGDADGEGPDAHLLDPAGDHAVEEDFGFAGGVVDGFDVGPGDAGGPAGADHFHDGLLDGEPGGEPFGGAAMAITVLLFGGGEDAVEEALAVRVA